jgi:tetratricopeptide (TPR) repeat protein
VSPARHLDIAADDPEEYEGRLVIVGDAEYVIGPCVGQGGERFVHSLVNRRTGLGLHLVKILRHQATAALKADQLGRNLTRLRDMGLPTVDPAQVVHGHGGVFEVEEAAGDMEPYAEELQRIRTALEAGCWTECEEVSSRILAAAPAHVVALHVLAIARARQGDHGAAVELEYRAVELEPNVRLYWGQLLESAGALGAVHSARDAFAVLRHKWPHDHRWNELGVQLLLMTGRPDEAAALKAPGSADLARQIRKETRDRDRARRHLDAARRASEAGRAERAAKELRAAYGRYPKDVDVAFNHGIALLHGGRYTQAHDVLVGIVQFVPLAWREQCLGTVGFALALDGRDARAATMFELVVAELDRNVTAPADSAKAVDHPVWDLPVWPVWWRGDSVVGARSDRAAVIVAARVRRLDAQGGAPEPLRRLSRAYRQGLAGFLNT